MKFLDFEEFERLQAVAEDLMLDVHGNQVDKAGAPYIGHLRRVEQLVCNIPRTPEIDISRARLVALLHDVLEDGPGNGFCIGANNLFEFGFDFEVVQAVSDLTFRKPDLSHRNVDGVHKLALITKSKLEYYERIKLNPLARLVKLADLADNNNEFRASELQRRRVAFDKTKYPLALAVLELSDFEWEAFNMAIRQDLTNVD
jgi:(p)ppGpp synthase/HD superfamily hydrolase